MIVIEQRTRQGAAKAASRLNLNESRERERVLVEGALEGHEYSFSGLVRLYEGRVASTVYSILGGEHVEEISHLAFVRAFGSIERFRRDSSFYTYLIRITINLCFDEIRSKGARPVHTFSEVSGKANDARLDDQIPNLWPDDPAYSYEMKEAIEIVRKEIQKLGPLLGAAIALREIYELGYTEIAETLGIGVNTAKTRVSRAKRILRTRLNHELT